MRSHNWSNHNAEHIVPFLWKIRDFSRLERLPRNGLICEFVNFKCLRDPLPRKSGHHWCESMFSNSMGEKYVNKVRKENLKSRLEM